MNNVVDIYRKEELEPDSDMIQLVFDDANESEGSVDANSTETSNTGVAAVVIDANSTDTSNTGLFPEFKMNLYRAIAALLLTASVAAIVFLSTNGCGISGLATFIDNLNLGWHVSIYVCAATSIGLVAATAYDSSGYQNGNHGFGFFATSAVTNTDTQQLSQPNQLTNPNQL